MIHHVCDINIIFSSNENVDVYFIQPIPVSESTRLSENRDSSSIPNSLTSLTSVSERELNSTESREVSTNITVRKSIIDTSSIVDCQADISSSIASPPKKKKVQKKSKGKSKPPGKSKKGKFNLNLPNANTKNVSVVNELKFTIHGSPVIDKVFLIKKNRFRFW